MSMLLITSTSILGDFRDDHERDELFHCRMFSCVNIGLNLMGIRTVVITCRHNIRVIMVVKMDESEY